MEQLETVQSKEINELAKALVAVQAELQPAIKDSANPFFKSKYADLLSVVKVSRKLLTDHGLAVIQTNEPCENGVVIVTTLAHTSGQWIKGRLFIPPVKSDPQAFVASNTYGRRSAYSAIIGIVTDEDDDGETASGRRGDEDVTFVHAVAPQPPPAKPAYSKPAPPPKPSAPAQGSFYDEQPPLDAYDDVPPDDPAPPKSSGKSGKLISEAQAKRFFAIAAKAACSKADIHNILQAHGFTDIREANMEVYDIICGGLEKIIKEQT